jgi:hypothetical protein
MTHTKFKVGDFITVTKPRNTLEGPSWNESTSHPNMEYLTEGTHEIHSIGTYIYIYDHRMEGVWSLDPRWCTLAYESSIDESMPHYKVLRKIKTLQHRRKEAGYAF